MSLPEYLPTDLPQYVKTTSRSQLENAVVGSGYVLLFAQQTADGIQLVAKTHQGTYVPAGGQDIFLGVTVAGGTAGTMFQKLSFNGTEASDSGAPVDMGSSAKTWNTGHQ